MGVAPLGSLATFVYRSELPDALAAAVPAEAANVAREGITAAVGAAEQLAGQLGADLLDGARTAFTTGLNTVTGVGAAVFFGLAILAAAVLRHCGQADSAKAGVEADPAPATAAESCQR